MKGLLLKDIYTMKETLKSLVFAFIIFFISGYINENPMYITMMLSMLSIVTLTTGMAYDEQSGWNEYVLALPVSRKDIVIEKYIFSLGILIFSVIVSIGSSFLIMKLKGSSDMEEILITNYGVFISVLFIVSLIMPALFKYGPQKARVILFLIGMLPFFIISIIAYFKPELSFLEKDIKTIVKIVPLVGIIFILLSAKISLKIIEKKDF